MSNALAIAGVTAVLRDLLNNGLIDHNVPAAVGDVTVAVGPPDRVPIDEPRRSQLNLFLHQVTPNPGWRNVGLPSRDSNGERISNPPLPLNLHYLLTAYGAEDFDAEVLLGFAMQLLHETPVLTRAALRKALDPAPMGPGRVLPDRYAGLEAIDLAEQVEQVKICPETMGGEEMSRLWSALQARYRPTVAYEVSVVLIESRSSTRTALPVRARSAYVIPFRQPFLEQVHAQEGPNQPIVASATILIRGKGLGGPGTRVRIGDDLVRPSEESDTQLTLRLVSLPPPRASDALSSDTLRAGVKSVQVVQPLSIGSPPIEHRGFESNVLPFVLRPTVTASAGAPTSREVKGAVLHSADVTVTFNPRVGTAQRVILLLNQLAADAAAAYTFLPPAGPRPDDASTITFRATDVRPGSYFVRVQVDGAESPLVVDEQRDSPTFGQRIPQVTI